MSRVTGAIRSTVVTLSSSAERTAVTMDSITRMPHGRAFTFLADQMARNWKTPVRWVTATMTIIPVRSPMVFQSMPWMAADWFG